MDTKQSAIDLEAEVIANARRFSFGGRIDADDREGPVFVEAKGSVMTDLRGKEYLDFNSGQMCSALGHNHPRIVEAIRAACDTMIHGHSSYLNVPEVELATRLAAILPAPLTKSLFAESGADANELALLIARMFTGGEDVFSPHVSYHGLSTTARSVTFAGWRRGHGQAAPGAHALLAPYCYRCPIAAKFPSCELACLNASFELVDAQASSQPAAVITEPLFSAGGVIAPPPGWLQKLHDLCKERGMLLIIDDEQTGLGKLGTMWGFEDEGVIPDLVTLAKHLGGGVGISSVSTSPEIEEVVISKGLTVTRSHSNDPLPCAAGVASLDIIESEDVPTRAKAIGEQMLWHLRELAERFELIGDIRGRGMLTGVELVTDRSMKEPAGEQTRQLFRACFEAGLMFSLRRTSVIRFVPPATTTESQIDHAMEIFGRELEKVSTPASATRAPAG